MKNIKLFSGELTVVDDDDYERLSSIPWSIDNYGYPQNSFRGTTVRMHQSVIGEPPDGKEIHHKDTNKLNNQKSNLEFITYNSHAHLSRKKMSKMGYWGVFQHGVRFKAKIMKNYKSVHLGVFDTAEEAAHAYDKKAVELHGIHAKLNFPV